MLHSLSETTDSECDERCISRVLYGPFLLPVSSVRTDSEGILPGRDLPRLPPSIPRAFFFLSTMILRVCVLDYLCTYLLALLTVLIPYNEMLTSLLESSIFAELNLINNV